MYSMEKLLTGDPEARKGVFPMAPVAAIPAILHGRSAATITTKYSHGSRSAHALSRGKNSIGSSELPPASNQGSAGARR